MQQRVEADIEEILRPYFDALEGTRAIVVGSGEFAELEHVPDYYLRLTAAEKLLDRVYGKPRQVQELTGEDGGPIRISQEMFADPKLRKMLHEVVRRAGAARTGQSGGSGAGD